MTGNTSRSLFALALLAIAAPGIAQSPWVAPLGDGGCGSNFVPTFHTAGEMPRIDNTGFRLVSENLIGGTPGFLLLSSSSTSLTLLGMTLYVGPSPLFTMGCQAAGTAGIAGAGTMNLPLPIPNDSALVNGRLFLQGFFVDPTLASTLVHTRGLGLTIASGALQAVSVIHDRAHYQVFFSGLSPSQAFIAGRVIWTANQVPGFAYSRTEQFSCGGQSHWLVIVQHQQTGLEFCLVPGGSFRMGDVTRTGAPTELPVRRVRVQPFLLARTELPQSAWQGVMPTNPSNFPGPNNAVDSVDWNGAQAFCAKTGLRLPSEAEWEYACRAGVETCYHFGENHPSANLGLYGWFVYDNGLPSRPVASKLPNAFGLFDMHGGVSEWCEDQVESDGYDCAPSDGRAWSRIATYRASRGGSWVDFPVQCRSASRRRDLPGFPGNGFRGFRPAGPRL